MNRAKALRDDVALLYDRATTSLLKDDVFLHFAFADFEEVGLAKLESLNLKENRTILELIEKLRRDKEYIMRIGNKSCCCLKKTHGVTKIIVSPTFALLQTIFALLVRSFPHILSIFFVYFRKGSYNINLVFCN